MYPPPHDLTSFFQSATQEMAREYERIYRHATKDPGTAGDQGEENWRKLLERWLPPQYHIVTKRRILTAHGEETPQIDVLVLHPYYPRALHDNKYYLDAGVIAAFECKTTLRAHHVSEAVSNAALIRRTLRARKGTPYHELHSPIIYGLLAHSHAWKGKNSRPIEIVTDQLWSADEEFVSHPRESLDLICISDAGFWFLSRSYVTAKETDAPENSAVEPTNGEKIQQAETVYFCATPEDAQKDSGFTPIGAFVSNLITRVAWEDAELRDLAWYFYEARLMTVAFGKGKLWPPKAVFSKELLDRPVETSKDVGDDRATLWSYWTGAWL